jgi:hypothetical protein
MGKKLCGRSATTSISMMPTTEQRTKQPAVIAEVFFLGSSMRAVYSPAG